MATPADFLVSSSGQMSVPAPVRHRWGVANGLWLFRLSSSFAAPGALGKLSAPVSALPATMQEQFRAQLISLPAEIEVLHLRDLAWSMAGLQHRHRQLGHHLSAAMVEVLAAAHTLGADIAVSDTMSDPTREQPHCTMTSPSMCCSRARSDRERALTPAQMSSTPSRRLSGALVSAAWASGPTGAGPSMPAGR